MNGTERERRIGSSRLPRRSFLRLAGLGGSALLLTGKLPAAPARTAGKAEALLLSCMDFRLVDDIERYMAGRGLRDRYDHVVLAGAALGAVSDRFPAWKQTFWDHLGLAVDLHQVHSVIVMDHRDCGAYRTILAEELAADPVRETKVHGEKLKQLAAQIRQQRPELEVELLLMGVDGVVEPIA